MDHSIFYVANVSFVGIIGFAELLFAIMVLFANKKSEINQLFFAIIIANLLWIIFTFIANNVASTKEAILLSKIAFIPPYLYLLGIYFFVNFFPVPTKRSRILDIVVILGTIFNIVITLGTNLHIQSVGFSQWGSYPILGKDAYLVYGIILLITAIFSIIAIRNYAISSSVNRKKMQYFLLGLLIFMFINIVFNIFLAPYYAHFPYYYLGVYSAIFFIGFTAYAIVKNKFLDIKIFLSDILIVSIILFVLIDWILSQNTIEYAFKGIVFILVVVFSSILISSIKREIQTREQLQALAKQLEADNEKLKKLDEMKTDFVSMTAHQLRTPLTVIKGYLSMVLEEDYGAVQAEQQKDILAKTMDSSDKLIGLVNDILDVTHLEGEGINYDFKKTNITDIVKDAAEGLQEKAQAKKLFITVTDPNFQGMVFADADKLRQVFTNLIDNAIKYTKIGGVTILLRREITQGVPYIVVGIQDTGLGFRPEDQNILFTKFGRTSDAIHSSIEGSGLGLYIVKKIVTDHHGEIWAESAGVNQGATFWVRMREA